VKTTNSPGKTVGYSEIEKAIFMKNPGNFNNSDLRKENVGIKTRHGFTYGKYRAKIMFPKVLSSDNVWNGVTCAFWLKYQEGDWNKRSNCRSGYNAKLLPKPTNPKESVYSEIDIEIVKTSRYWPKTSYVKEENYQVDDALNDNVIITCTNWDLACHDPINFNIGVRNIEYAKKEFALHRWDDDYRALSSKYNSPQNDILGQAVYYEIEWQPTYIIWRIGTSKNNMKIIGYMDESSTKIPNNQMEIVISQEFHDGSWWPLTPFKQDFIPFPENDIVGYIYEIEIE
jgi:hypothetical protein